MDIFGDALILRVPHEDNGTLSFCGVKRSRTMLCLYIVYDVS